eukprot:764266-Hanusia_phi.AAC.3
MGSGHQASSHGRAVLEYSYYSQRVLSPWYDISHDATGVRLPAYPASASPDPAFKLPVESSKPVVPLGGLDPVTRVTARGW